MSDAEARACVKHLQVFARRQWSHDNYQVDLSEYEDCAAEALLACLINYDPARRVRFSVYAEYRIAGSVKRAWHVYRTWHELRGGGRWFHAPPDADVLRPRSLFARAASIDQARSIALSNWTSHLPLTLQRSIEHILDGGKYAGRHVRIVKEALRRGLIPRAVL